jgi:hypothetical protein
MSGFSVIFGIVSAMAGRRRQPSVRAEPLKAREWLEMLTAGALLFGVLVVAFYVAARGLIS